MLVTTKCLTAVTLALFFSSAGLSQDSARMENIFPFFIKAGIPIDHYESRFELINPNSTGAVVSFQFFDPSGREIVPFSGSDSRSVPAGTVASDVGFVFAQATTVGWVRISSDQPILVEEDIQHKREASISFLPPSIETVSEVLMSPSIGARRQVVRIRYVASNYSANTGIALVFPSPDSSSFARGTATVRRSNGQKLGDREIVLSANSQLVRLVTELFPEVAEAAAIGFQGFDGTLELVFDKNIHATAIQLTALGRIEQMDEAKVGLIPIP